MAKLEGHFAERPDRWDGTLAMGSDDATGPILYGADWRSRSDAFANSAILASRRVMG